MSYRDWLPNPPLGVLTAVVVDLTGTALFNYEKHAQSTYQTARQEYEKSKRVVTEGTPAQGQHADPKAYRQEWRAEHDLEAQRLMAWWSRVAGIAASVGVALLAATLWETARTSAAAADAARAARDAVDVAVDVERPHVIITEIDPVFKADGSLATVKWTVRNVGRLPAIIVGSSAAFTQERDTARVGHQLSIVHGRERSTVLRENDTETFISLPYFDSADVPDFDPHQDVILYGRFTYESTLPKRVTRHFCMRGYRNRLLEMSRGSGLHLYWVEHGGPRFNYTVEETKRT